MTRMLGDLHQPWCPYCHGKPGMDCPDRGKDTRAAKRTEKRSVRKDIKEQLNEREK